MHVLELGAVEQLLTDMHGMQVLYQVAEALKALHAAGYAHRNLKPSNIVRCTGSSAWSFLDFGCAARIGVSFSTQPTVALCKTPAEK